MVTRHKKRSRHPLSELRPDVIYLTVDGGFASLKRSQRLPLYLRLVALVFIKDLRIFAHQAGAYVLTDNALTYSAFAIVVRLFASGF